MTIREEAKPMLRATAVKLAADASAESLPAAMATAVLAHDARHLRRKAVTLADGRKVLVDLPEPVVLAAGDRLVLEDGSHVEVAAAIESLLEVTARDRRHLAELAWHIGNRHLPAAIEERRILILDDHVIASMLEGLGARLRRIEAPFAPVRGAYSGHGEHRHDDGVVYRLRDAAGAR
jgi:urease accessory protein